MKAMHEWEDEALDAIPAHLDPSRIPPYARKDERVEEWGAEAKRVYLARKEIEEKVWERIERALTLTPERNKTVPDAYHVMGGKDPSGHTVDLRASWGEQCTCYDHMMNYRFCKHLIRVGMARGEFLADTWPAEQYVPGLFSRAVQVDLKNAARKAAHDAQQEDKHGTPR